MSAPFRLDGWTFSSSAFEILGNVAGYDAHAARGRWAWAGSEATERQSYVFTEAAVRGMFGERGVDALIAAELAERVEGGLRMLRMDGAIEWYGDITSKRRRAGLARASGAERDARGRLLPSSMSSTSPARAGVLDQHQTSAPPPSSSSPDPVPVPDLPDRGELLDLKPPGRERSRRKPAAALPATWEPRIEDNRLSGVQLENELAKFRAYATANDRRQVDWDASWRGWQLKAVEYAQNRRPPIVRGGEPPATDFDTEMRVFGTRGGTP